MTSEPGKILRLGEQPIRCPLCLKFMQKKYDGARHIFILACDNDRVAIAVDDPFVGKWEAALEREKGGKIPCPVCGTDTRYFCTSTGYMKAKCPKKGCGASLATAEPDRPRATTIPQ